MSRLDHRKLHKQLEEMGYDIFIIDYEQGGHTYQIQLGKDHHEYAVEKQNGEKVVNLYGVDGEIFNLIAEYYSLQDVKVIKDLK